MPEQIGFAILFLDVNFLMRPNRIWSY